MTKKCIVAPRAWLVKEEKMVRVVRIDYADEEERSGITYEVEIRGPDGSYNAMTDIGFDDCTLLQPTGLKDCKGVEIFEGDVISETAVGGDKGQVMFGKSKSAYGWYTVGFFIKWINGFETNLFPASDKASTWEVIGNTKENPELLAQRGEDD